MKPLLLLIILLILAGCSTSQHAPTSEARRDAESNYRWAQANVKSAEQQRVEAKWILDHTL